MKTWDLFRSLAFTIPRAANVSSSMGVKNGGCSRYN
jgi:hypothetical protein